MSIVIDPLKCIGCTKCTQVCPGTLIEMTDLKMDNKNIQKTAGAAFHA